MKITDILKERDKTLSFEVFPPKTEEKFAKTVETIDMIADINPAFMSVTYGAGGGVSDFTDRICTELEKRGMTAMAHLTCVSSTEERVKSMIAKYKDAHIENIMALRGDIPEDFDYNSMRYKHASDIVPEIKAGGDFCIGGACYPEKHPDSKTLEEDIENLKFKIDAGCDFLTTQMFFDNGLFYDFMDKLAAKGISLPVLPGIMPITSVTQVDKVVRISSCSTPEKFDRLTEKYADDPEGMRSGGIEYAIEQIEDLYANGVKNIHVYAMNKPSVVKEIYDAVKGNLK